MIAAAAAEPVAEESAPPQVEASEFDVPQNVEPVPALPEEIEIEMSSQPSAEPQEVMDSTGVEAAPEAMALEPLLAEDVSGDDLIADDVSEDDEEVVPAKRPLRLGERLLEMGLIAEDQLEIALREQKDNGSMLGTILVEMGFITESALGEVLAESAGTSTFDASQVRVDPTLLEKIPQEVCARNKVIPVSQEADGSIQLAMADVYNVLAIDQVRRYFDKGAKIVPLFATESEISDQIDRYYKYEMSIDGILREIETGIRDNTQLDGQAEGYVNPTVRLIDALLIDSVKQGASDIHFEPEGTFLRLRYRIDGKLEQIRSFHRDYWAAMLVRLKIMSQMNIAETRQAQDGRIGFNVMGKEVDFRVATQPTVHGENVVLRLLDKSKALISLESLGFREHNMELLKKCLKRPEGIIIVTGPTGSGKTTTLYSILSFINSIDVNIMTLEDPVEYKLPLIRQTYVKEGTMTFAGGIKSLMRQDPDIIFIGEVRDEETAINAVRAALTGHQVYTTLHTNDALGAIPRLGDIGVPAHMLSGSLICSLAQRLARKLCPDCKEPYTANEEECRILGVDPSDPPTIYKAVGCESCGNKGHKGRTAILEILRVDDGMNELISTHATRQQMLEYAVANGFETMIDDGVYKVLNGEVDLPELMKRVDLTDRL